MSIAIDRAANGWYLIHSEEGELDQVYVFDEGETDEDEAEAFSRLLWHIKTLCGPQESRYSAYRVMIKIEPGDKHSSHPDNQEDE